MNLPNKLTISRIILTFVFMLFLFSKGILARYLALAIFLAASLTDLCDGRIARKKNLVTDFGRLMDPIADKILILGAFLAFVELNIIPAWMVVLIITRELFITGLRLLATRKKIYLASDRGGKHKTVSQMVAIFSILIFLALKETALRFFTFWNTSIEHWFNHGIFVLMLVTVALTLISGVSYLQKNKQIFIQYGQKNN